MWGDTGGLLAGATVDAMSRPSCARCGRRREVAYTAFNPGEATFRPLCLDCERVEMPENQPVLFDLPVDESKVNAPAYDPIAQLTLF